MSFGKRDLADELFAKHGGLTREEVDRAVDLLVQAMGRTLRDGAPLKVSGFGSFKKVAKKVRLVQLPSGDLVHSGGWRVKFVPAKALKFRVNGDDGPSE